MLLIVNPPEFRSKNEHVYSLLKEKIILGELKPGEAIVTDALARDLGVSPIPIREALRHLEANGFVHIQPYVGTRVAEIHTHSIYEVFSMLEAMEILSGRAACTMLTNADLDHLEGMIREMSSLLDDPNVWSDYNKRLHQFICHHAQMYLVEKMLLVALDHWDRLRRYYLDEVFAQRVRARQGEHEQMLEALRQRDAEALERVMRYHNQESFRAYKAHLEKTNRPFPVDSGNQ